MIWTWQVQSSYFAFGLRKTGITLLGLASCAWRYARVILPFQLFQLFPVPVLNLMFLLKVFHVKQVAVC